MDMMVHGWDLAKATAHTVDWNSELIAATISPCRSTFDNAEFCGTDFALPIEVADDAEEVDRLAAFLGRRP